MLKTELGERIAGSFECRGGFKRRSHGGPAMASHLTLEERQFLYRLKKRRKSNAEIAELWDGTAAPSVAKSLATRAGVVIGRGKPNAWPTSVVWQVADPTKWMTPTCTNTSKTDSKNIGRRIRSPVGRRATSRVPQRGCRGKPFTIGFTIKCPSGRPCCVAVVGLRKNGGN